MARILGLDIGDKWTGTAVCDPSGIICRPLQTVKTEELEGFLTDFLQNNAISEIVCGIPLTCMGTEGEQVKKTKLIIESLKNLVTKMNFDSIKFIEWDERRSSKMASSSLNKSKKKPNPDDKLKIHSVAAAFILQSYTDFKNLDKTDF